MRPQGVNLTPKRDHDVRPHACLVLPKAFWALQDKGSVSNFATFLIMVVGILGCIATKNSNNGASRPSAAATAAATAAAAAAWALPPRLAVLAVGWNASHSSGGAVGVGVLVNAF